MYTRTLDVSRDARQPTEVSSIQRARLLWRRGSCRSRGEPECPFIGREAGAQVFEARRIGQRHPVGTESPRGVDRDHADRLSLALAAVDDPRPVFGLLQEHETLRAPG